MNDWLSTSGDTRNVWQGFHQFNNGLWVDFLGIHFRYQENNLVCPGNISNCEWRGHVFIPFKLSRLSPLSRLSTSFLFAQSRTRSAFCCKMSTRCSTSSPPDSSRARRPTCSSRWGTSVCSTPSTWSPPRRTERLQHWSGTSFSGHPGPTVWRWACILELQTKVPQYYAREGLLPSAGKTLLNFREPSFEALIERHVVLWQSGKYSNSAREEVRDIHEPGEWIRKVVRKMCFIEKYLHNINIYSFFAWKLQFSWTFDSDIDAPVGCLLQVRGRYLSTYYIVYWGDV